MEGFVKIRTDPRNGFMIYAEAGRIVSRKVRASRQ
jgi:hypothetical protein